jgi:Kef-type K+ transport system membrane component KefB
MDRRERRIRRLLICAYVLFGALVVLLLVMIDAAGWFLLLSIHELARSPRSVEDSYVSAALVVAAFWGIQRLSATSRRLHGTIRRELRSKQREIEG